MGADVDGKNSNKRYKGKLQYLLKLGVDPVVAARKARGYAGGKTSPKAGKTEGELEAEGITAGEDEQVAVPYSTANDLPSTVKDALPPKAQKIWMKAYNSATEDEAHDADSCTIIAWEAINEAGYTKQAEGWVKASDRVGKIHGMIALQEAMLTPAPSGLQYSASSMIEIMRTGQWDHPLYGILTITSESMDGFIANFYNNVRGIDLAVDKEHEPEAGALGWFKKLWKVPSDDGEGSFSLMAEIQWTWQGEQLIRDGVYRYFSPEFDFEWTDPETANTYSNVLFGGALTNRPFIKRMDPIILSEDMINNLGFVFNRTSGKQTSVPGSNPPDKGSGKQTKGGDVDVKLSKEHYQALGLSEGATDEQILEAIKAKTAVPPTGLKLSTEHLTVLGLSEGATDEQVLNAIKAVNTEKQETVQLSETVRHLNEKMTALQGQTELLNKENIRLAEAAKEARWEKVSQDAFRDGRMTVTLAEKFKPLFVANPDSIEPIIASLPKVIAGETGTSGAAGSAAGSTTKLSESQDNVAKQLGLSEDAMLKNVPAYMKPQGE